MPKAYHSVGAGPQLLQVQPPKTFNPLTNLLYRLAQVFPTCAGGAERMANSMGVDLLGRVPLDPAVSRACESGRSLFELNQDGQVGVKQGEYTPTSLPALNAIVSKLVEKLG